MVLEYKITRNYVKGTSQPWQQDKDSEDLGVLFFDADQDGITTCM